MTTPEDPIDSAPEKPAGSRLRRPLIGPFTGGQVVAVVVAIVVTLVGLTVLTTPLNGKPGATPPRPGSSGVSVGPPEEGFRVGDVAPEFEGSIGGNPITLSDLNGNPIRLADLRGRPVWINFWATWCPPCQEETPILREMQEKYGDDGLALVAISVQETTADDVRAFVETYDLRYTVGFDATSAIFHTYHAFVLPTQFFVDRNGVIREVMLGPVGRDQADQIITGLLAS